jgi:hypothetical protein
MAEVYHVMILVMVNINIFFPVQYDCVSEFVGCVCVCMQVRVDPFEIIVFSINDTGSRQKLIDRKVAGTG